MSTKFTKKAFKEFLNNGFGMDGETGHTVNHSGGHSFKGQQKRQYGDYLYSADKGMFDYYYDMWVESGGKSMDKWVETK